MFDTLSPAQLACDGCLWRRPAGAAGSLCCAEADVTLLKQEVASGQQEVASRCAAQLGWDGQIGAFGIKQEKQRKKQMENLQGSCHNVHEAALFLSHSSKVDSSVCSCVEDTAGAASCGFAQVPGKKFPLCSPSSDEQLRLSTWETFGCVAEFLLLCGRNNCAERRNFFTLFNFFKVHNNQCPCRINRPQPFPLVVFKSKLIELLNVIYKLAKEKKEMKPMAEAA